MTDILNLPTTNIGGGTLYDTSPYLIVPKVINASWNKGIDMQTAYSAKIASNSTAIDTLLATPASNHVSAGTVTGATATEPSVTIPTSISVANVYDEYQVQYLELVAMLDGKLTAFRTTYFPNEAALYSAAEASLQAALSSGSYIPATVQQQIFGDDQARINNDKERAKASVEAQFAARGFPLPPDVLASATMQIEQKAQDQLAESSRKIAIMSVDQYRFVIEKVMTLRDSAMKDAVAYISALASGPDMASRLVGVGYDAQSKLISSVSQLYGTRIEAAKMVNQVAQYNNSTQLEVASKNQMADLNLIGEKIKALLGEAASLAQMATSLFNNIHGSAGISGSTSNSVGYSYSNDTNATAPAITSVG